MTPTIGRIVHYTQPGHEPSHNGSRTHPAIITAVHSATCVNLKVFFDFGPVEDRSSVSPRGALSGEVAEGWGFWEWPARQG